MAKGLDRLKNLETLDQLHAQRELVAALIEELHADNHGTRRVEIRELTEALSALALARLSERLPVLLGDLQADLRALGQFVAKLS